MIPYCVDSCNNADHYCPICRVHLGTCTSWWQIMSSERNNLEERRRAVATLMGCRRLSHFAAAGLMVLLNRDGPSSPLRALPFKSHVMTKSFVFSFFARASATFQTLSRKGSRFHASYSREALDYYDCNDPRQRESEALIATQETKTILSAAASVKFLATFPKIFMRRWTARRDGSAVPRNLLHGMQTV